MYTSGKSPCLLVSSPQIKDGFFRRKVVLLVEDTESGSFGFVINHLLSYELNELFHKKIIEQKTPAWSGGPVEPYLGIVLHNSNDVTPNKIIADQIYLTSSQNASEVFAKKDTAKGMHGIRFLVGYSGWAKGQLLKEIRMGQWLKLDLNLDVIFSTHYTEIWEKSLSFIGIQQTSHVITHQVDWLQ